MPSNRQRQKWKQRKRQTSSSLPSKIDPAVAIELREQIKSEVLAEIGSGGLDDRIRGTVAEFFSGPTPHPDHMQKYNEILLGAAQFFLDAAKTEQDARITRWGRQQIFAFILNLGGLISMTGIILYITKGALDLIKDGMNLQGFSMALLALASLVGTAYWGQKVVKGAFKAAGSQGT